MLINVIIVWRFCDRFEHRLGEIQHDLRWRGGGLHRNRRQQGTLELIGVLAVTRLRTENMKKKGIDGEEIMKQATDGATRFFRLLYVWWAGSKFFRFRFFQAEKCFSIEIFFECLLNDCWRLGVVASVPKWSPNIEPIWVVLYKAHKDPMRCSWKCWLG